MLHFLIGVAVCIWIAERVGNYLAIRQLASPAQPKPERVAQTSLWFLVVPVAAVIIGLILAHS